VAALQFLRVSSLHTRLTIAIAAVAPLWGAYSFYLAQRSAPNDIFQVEAHVAHLEGVRQMVPENAVVGFITDVPDQLEPGPNEFPLFLSKYCITQYGITPRLLKSGATGHWVLGVFTSDPAFETLNNLEGLQLTRFFGQGVVLFESRKE